MVVPVMPMFNDYAIELQTKLHLQGIVIDTDLDDGWVDGKCLVTWNIDTVL